MDKEELIVFLKENLKIVLDSDEDYDYYGGGSDTFTVKLKLGEEIIDESNSATIYHYGKD